MRNKRAASTVGFVGGVIGLIVGVVMLPVILSVTDDVQTTQFTTSNYSITTNDTITLDYDNVVASTLGIDNGSRTNLATNNDVNYYLNARQGLFAILNISDFGSSAWKINYSYYPDGYVANASGRIIVRQFTLLFAVGLILAGVAVAGLSLRE